MQVCLDFSRPLSTVDDLYIWPESRSGSSWEDDAIENTLWLRFLLPFTAVKNLYVFEDFASVIAAALQQLAVECRITEVLPNLMTIFVAPIGLWGPLQEQPFQEHIGPFIAARRLAGYPITTSVWDWGNENSDWFWF